MPQRQDQQQQVEIHAKIFRRNLGNAGVVRILDLIDQILGELRDKLRSIEYWQRVAQVFLLPTTSLRFTTTPQLQPGSKKNLPHMSGGFMGLGAAQNGGLVLYELNLTTAPRFFAAAVALSLIQLFYIHLPGLKFQVFASQAVLITANVVMTYVYMDGSLAKVHGDMKLLMTRDFRIDWADVKCHLYQSSVLLAALERQLHAFQEKTGVDVLELISQVCRGLEAAKHARTVGLDDTAMQVMQILDVMGQLRLLMQFSMVNNVVLPVKALDMFVNANHAAATAAGQPPRPPPLAGLKRGSVLSPSPLTTFAEDPKQAALKKRKMSSVGSPLTK